MSPVDAWKGAEGARSPAARQQMIRFYLPLALAAGEERGILARLKQMKASAGIYAAAAKATAQAGKADVATELLFAVPAAAAAEDAKTAEDVAAAIGGLQQQGKQRDDRLRAFAGQFAAAEKQAAEKQAAEKKAADKKAAAVKEAKQPAQHAKPAALETKSAAPACQPLNN